MASIDTLAGIDLFTELSKTELRAVGRLMSAATARAGRVLIEEGKPGREAFIIVGGTASVRRRGRLIVTVGPGTVVGEMALIAGLPRTATVIAETDIELEVLNRREFADLLDANPKLAKKIMIGVVKRLHQLEPGLLN